MNITEKLINLRKEKGYTQEQLADLFKISVTAIRNYENIKNPRTPKNEILLRYAKEFDVSLEYLLDDTVNNRKQENIEIGKTLGLTDESIKNLKEITNRPLKRRINFLLGDIEILAKTLHTIEIWEDKRWEKKK